MSKKKIFYWVVAVIILLGLGGVIGYTVVHHNETKSEVLKNDTIEVVPVLTSVEDCIKNDNYAMSLISKDFKFFESRIVLAKPFNECDSAEIDEITNVYQVNKGEGDSINTTVYMLVHNYKDKTSAMEMHVDAFMTDDIEMNIDSIKVTFDQAFKSARQSNYPPSKSKYITLRHGFGRYACNPFYTIGNEDYGHLWVDAITGEVMDKDPSTIKK